MATIGTIEGRVFIQIAGAEPIEVGTVELPITGEPAPPAEPEPPVNAVEVDPDEA